MPSHWDGYNEGKHDFSTASKMPVQVFTRRNTFNGPMELTVDQETLVAKKGDRVIFDKDVFKVVEILPSRIAGCVRVRLTQNF